jgi:hypothetical protein
LREEIKAENDTVAGGLVVIQAQMDESNAQIRELVDAQGDRIDLLEQVRGRRGEERRRREEKTWGGGGEGVRWRKGYKRRRN